MSESMETRVPWHARLVVPGMVLLAVAALLFAVRSDVRVIEALRTPWNAHWWVFLTLHIGWIACLSLGAVFLILRLVPWMTFANVSVVLLVLLLAAAVLFPVLTKARDTHHHYLCPNNQRQHAAVALMYSQDHAGAFPENCQVIFFQLQPETRACHATQSPYRPWGGYGFNGYLAGKRLEHPEAASRTLLTADSVRPDMLLATPRDFARRHQGRYIASFADGHVEALTADVALKPGE